MVSIKRRAAALFLCLAILFSLVGCLGDREDIHEGIEIKDDAPISEAAKEKAAEVIEELIIYGYKSAVKPNIDDAKRAELSALAERVLPLTLDSSLSEAQYIYLFDTLAERGEGVIDELEAYMDGEASALPRSAELYGALCSVLGADAVGSLLYDICVLRYEIRLEKLRARYEQYGFAYILTDIADAEADMKTLRENIGKRAFSAIIKNAVAAVALMRGGLESMGSLTCGELLIILSHLEIEDIQIGKEGWSLVFSLITPSGGETYGAKMIKALKDSGDADELAAVMDDAVKFAAHIQSRLTKDDIEKIRNGQGGEAIGRIFESLNSEELALFGRITAIEPENEIYSALAIAEYGEEYSEYLAQTKEVSYGELCLAIGTDSFSDILDEYLTCRFGALYYEVSR